jgi:biotin transporter BioY
MKSIIPLAIFVSVAVVVSAFTHKYINKRNYGSFAIACLIAGLLTSVIFQILGYFVLGYLDPFFIIAFVVGAFVAAGIAVPVGIFQRKIIKDKEVA